MWFISLPVELMPWSQQAEPELGFDTGLALPVISFLLGKAPCKLPLQSLQLTPAPLSTAQHQLMTPLFHGILLRNCRASVGRGVLGIYLLCADWALPKALCSNRACKGAQLPGGRALSWLLLVEVRDSSVPSPAPYTVLPREVCQAPGVCRHLAVWARGKPVAVLLWWFGKKQQDQTSEKVENLFRWAQSDWRVCIPAQKGSWGCWKGAHLD